MAINPVIVIPGITASYLDDHYPLPPEAVWSVLTKEYERAALHPDNVRYEAIEPARVRGGQLFEVCYRELIEELRYNLRESEDKPIPVYPFSYDWRQPLDSAADELAAFVDEVIERTALIRHYSRAGYTTKSKVNLVVHSMGGLVALAYLSKVGAASRVEKVVSLATPFRGSFEAVIKITTGTANLGTPPPSSREREAARTTPSLYALLPDLPDAVSVDDSTIPKDLFNIGAWQPSVIDTIEEYIRLHGLNQTDRPGQARALFRTFLSTAKEMRDRLKGFQLKNAKLKPDDWLCVVGVNADTRVALKITRTQGKPDFDFSSDDRANNWEETAGRMQTGDGTVPLPGALPHFLAPEKIVCIKPGDFGYWELIDTGFSKIAGFHGILPNMDMLHRMIVRFFKNARDPRENTWGMPLPNVPPDKWDPPLNGGLRIRDSDKPHAG